MIDIKKAKEAFAEYTRNYDPSLGKIRVKIAHIERVSQNSKKIAEELGLSKEQINLAQLIGLLHDIGRFEQIRQFDTYIDKDSVNHGELGVKILFEEGLIREFVQEKDYDEIIKKAILIHNTKKVPDGLTKEEELQARIIRDADKIDIYYALITEPIQDLYNCDTMEEDDIQDEIVREFEEEHYIDYNVRQTPAESLISHLAYVFDLNYSSSLKIIKEKQYIDRLSHRFSFQKEETKQKIEKCAKIAKEYLEEKTK